MKDESAIVPAADGYVVRPVTQVLHTITRVTYRYTSMRLLLAPILYFSFFAFTMFNSYYFVIKKFDLVIILEDTIVLRILSISGTMFSFS